jgi:hypothetical protein
MRRKESYRGGGETICNSMAQHDGVDTIASEDMFFICRDYYLLGMYYFNTYGWNIKNVN